MRICVATGVYPPEIGGPATHAVFLEEYLREKGIIPVVVPYRVVKHVPKLFRHLLYTWKLIRASRDTVGIYALDTVSVGFPTLLASILTRKPYILRVPGDYAWEQGQQRFGVTDTLDAFLTRENHPFPVRVLSWIQSCVARRASRIIVPSEYLRRVVMSWGVEESKIDRVYSVLQDVSVTESKDVLRKEYGYAGHVITTAGRLVPWKGMGTLIRVAHTLTASGFPVSLEIIGDGNLRGELQKLIESYGATSYVHLLGILPHDEVARRVKASDVFALNTSYEGMSHHLLEAMSLGTPVVTTPVGGNVELITDGETGLLVPYDDEKALGDTLRRLLGDESMRQKLRERAEGALKPFREDVVIDGIVTTMNRVWNSSH